MRKGELSVFMPMRLKKRGGRKMILKGPTMATPAEIRQISNDINKVTAKYVQLILRLNFLAPKLKEVILLGHQPRLIKIANLMQNIPSLWHEQGELFSCEVI